ncbi:MAG: hypothetical protein JNM64_02725 [Chloroflexia bacterium]|nr:hypothetical protein [Chloroflexia bacterium]
MLASKLKSMLSGLRGGITHAQTNWRAAAPVGIDEVVDDAVVRYEGRSRKTHHAPIRMHRPLHEAQRSVFFSVAASPLRRRA